MGLPGVMGFSNGFSSTAARVWATTLWDPDGPGPQAPAIVVAGFFEFAGDERASNIAMWNGTQWLPLGTGIAGEVIDLAVLPNGNLVAGGAFIQAGGTTVNNIAIWNGSTWLDLDGGVDGAVTSLVIRPNGDLVAGGTFTIAGSVVARAIARWDGTAWSALGAGLRSGTSGNDPGSVNALALQSDGDIIVGGWFQRAGALVTDSIARVRINAAGAATWFTLGSGIHTGPDSAFVSGLKVLADGTTIVGGEFDTADGVAVSNVARWNPTTSTWSAMGSGFNAAPQAFAQLQNGTIVSVGSFWQSGTTVMEGVATWDGAAWQPISGIRQFYHGQYTDNVVSLSAQVLPSGDLLVGGDMSTGVARWNGSDWSPYGSGFSHDVTSITNAPNGDIIAAGLFTNISGVHAPKIARFDGSTWSQIGDGLPYTPGAVLAMPNGNIITSGTLVNYPSGVPESRIDLWNGSNWSNLDTGTFRVNSFARLLNGDIVASGNFLGTGGVYKMTTSGWVPLGEPFLFVDDSAAEPLTLLVRSNGDLIAAGFFDKVATDFITNVARWNGSAWEPVGFGLGNTGTFEGVSDLCETPAGDLVAVGQFAGNFDTIDMNGVARFDGASWVQLGNGIPDAFVLFTCAALNDGTIVAAGSAPGSPLWSWDGSSQWLPLAPFVEGYIGSIAPTQSGGLAISGHFARVGSNYDQLSETYSNGTSSAFFAVLGCAGTTCDSIDFNNDSSLFDPQDIDAFLSVFSEGPCVPATSSCNDIDFNNDSSLFDPCDIDSFLLMFSEGPCTTCGV